MMLKGSMDSREGSFQFFEVQICTSTAPQGFYLLHVSEQNVLCHLQKAGIQMGQGFAGPAWILQSSLIGRISVQFCRWKEAKFTCSRQGVIRHGSKLCGVIFLQIAAQS